MHPFAVAGIQMEVLRGKDNLGEMAQRAQEVMETYPWVQMLLFSELCCGHANAKHAQPLPGPIEEAFQDIARKHHVWLCPGSVYERDGDHVYNTTSMIGPDGEVIGRYRKMFPFLPYEPGVEPGTEPFVFDVPGTGRFGVSICYDMWFPETVRTLTALGAEVILHPSLTDTIDRDVELAIVRSTAACHQCFVLDVNGTEDGGNGRSLFCGPNGEVLYLAGSAEAIIPIEIELDRVRRAREVGLRSLGQPLKSFRDRRVEFPVYQRGARSAYFDMLGPLAKPERGSRAGLDGPRHPDL